MESKDVESASSEELQKLEEHSETAEDKRLKEAPKEAPKEATMEATMEAKEIKETVEIKGKEEDLKWNEEEVEIKQTKEGEENKHESSLPCDEKNCKDLNTDGVQTKVTCDVFKRPQLRTDVSQNEEKKLSDYANYITYTNDGYAIYTDPKTKYRYKWSETDKNWLPCEVENIDSKENPFENEHYIWCSETQSWKPKNTQITETEHYKWDAEKNAWFPKTKPIENEHVENEGKTYPVDENGQRIYTDKDGAVYFWDAEKNAWFPKIDDDFMARYQMNYGITYSSSADEEEKQKKEIEEAERKAQELKHMTDEARAAIDAASSGPNLKRKVNQEPPKWFEIDVAHNTKVYVSNLPLDITLDEFAELMGKCGMIMRDPKTQKFKLKLYTEADGQIKGDGLCDYIKVESVNLALNILDEYVYRGHKIRVQRAKFEMRGEYNPALKPKRKKKDKEKLQKMKERLFDWRPEKMRGERSKNEKVVIIKNLFSPDIFEKDVQLILDYQNDLREECGKCGTVRKVIIYDCHPEGVAQINMASPEEADLVIQMMQGRFFGKRQLSAEHWDGKTKYKIAESEKNVQERLSNWDQFLESEVDKIDKESS